ncbi:MAG: CheR family methyltransferase [Vicinamibacterales bacterium]
MSAGGLEAFFEMIEAIPPNPGFAIVLIQHLAPDHPSALPNLLVGRTPVPVVEATEGLAVENDRVYVIPPNRYLELRDGTLGLSPRPGERGPSTPIDFFFTSLARVQGDRAIAVVLSGTGSDGVVGLRAVKAAGGIVFAQKPETAKYDGMPRAAADTGLVDLLLPPAEIGRKLVQLCGYVDAGTTVLGRADLMSPGQLEEILELLRSASGVDFSHYKTPTVRRRILRRMALARVTEPAGYVDLLRARPEEVRSLYQDILIHVTRFFREPESFKALGESVLPALVAESRPESPIRIWVAGCSTGEELYSLAVTLFDCAGDKAPDLQVQLFGTDVSETAVEYARQGIYPASIADDVPPAMLRRFFTRTDGGYRIVKSIRDRCVFARQDLTRDPPFSKLDLILCRNVLIYMDVTLQRRLVQTFHYALRPRGHLVLGQAETIGLQSDLFALVDKKHRIYRKKPAERSQLSGVAPALTTYWLPRPAGVPAEADEMRGEARAAQKEANRVILDRYGPPGVLVNEDLQIIQFRGRTGAYLEPAPGDASLSLLKLAREGLLHGLRTALQSARKSRKVVHKEGLRVRSNGGWTTLDLEVVPLTALSTLHYLVLFHQRPSGRTGKTVRAQKEPREPRGSAKSRVARIEEELAATREYLQSVIQEVEAANEELQSANEEVLSSNEELQSTNEELDTAKEELQSTNEELNTLNDELQARNEELTRVNSDLMNLLGSVEIAIVIVSTDLKIRRFTPMAEKLFNLIPGDIGRPITQVRPSFECPDLGDLILDVVDRVAPFEREVRDADGRWFSLRIRPYKGLGNRIEGGVVAVVDIDAVKRHEAEITREREFAEAVLQTVRQPLLILDVGRHVRSVNRAFLEKVGAARSEVEGRSITDLPGDLWRRPDFRRALDRLLVEGLPVEGAPVDYTRPDGKSATLLVNARPVQGRDSAGADGLLLLTFEDVTGRTSGEADQGAQGVTRP